MALMSCPKCGERFSDKLSRCPACGLDSEFRDAEAVARQALREFRTRMYHLKMTSYVGLTLLTAGFIWYWSGSSGFSSRPGTGPWLLMAAGTVVYVVIRALMIRAKLNYRKLRQRL